jgi:hypothetical protein
MWKCPGEHGTPQLNLCLPVELIDAVRERAAEKDASLAQFVAGILTKALQPPIRKARTNV